MSKPDDFCDAFGKTLTVKTQQNALDDIKVFCTTAGNDAVGTQVSAESQWNKRALTCGGSWQIAGSDAGAGGAGIITEQVLKFRHQLGCITILDRENLD